MGESLSKATQPEELAVFKKMPVNTLLQNIEIPERPENRRPTDRKLLISFVVIVILLFPFLIYTMINSDFNRFQGYDQCGNICGQKNAKYDKWSCTGQDLTDSPFLQIDDSDSKTSNFYLKSRKCVETCGYDYFEIFSTCYRKISRTNDYYNDRFKRDTTEIDNDPTTYLSRNAWRIVLACFLSLGVSLIMMVLFKTATAAVVWGILGGVLLFGTILVGGLWYFYFNIDQWENSKDSKSAVMFLAVVSSVILLVLFCMMVFMYKRILLVIQLLKEATKAAFAMPLLIFTPVISFFVQLVIVALFFFTTAYMWTSGTLTEIAPGYLYYKQNIVMVFTLAFNFFVALWTSQFVVGIQYMVIAGAVAKWYWSRNKHNLDSPISKSANIVFRFHLGSIAFGSLVITLVAIIRAIISSLVKNKNLKAVVDCCLGPIETFIRFLSRNSYVLTAMHGKPFYKSGKRAAKIIFQNAVNISAVNFVGDFVLGMAQLLIVLISLLITVGIMQGADESASVYIVYIIVFLVSLAIAMTCFSIFETTIETLFLCFCEDSLLNDGMARPYAMSRDLMEFVENSKLVCKKE